MEESTNILLESSDLEPVSQDSQVKTTPACTEDSTKAKEGFVLTFYESLDSHKVPASQGAQVATSSCIWYTCVKDFDQDWDTSATRETPNAVKVSTSTWTPPVYQVQTKMGEITQVNMLLEVLSNQAMRFL